VEIHHISRQKYNIHYQADILPKDLQNMLKLAEVEIAGILDINTKKCLSLLATRMKSLEIKEYFSSCM
jgi:hypothetical protein